MSNIDFEPNRSIDVVEDDERRRAGTRVSDDTAIGSGSGSGGGGVKACVVDLKGSNGYDSSDGSVTGGMTSGRSVELRKRGVDGGGRNLIVLDADVGVAETPTTKDMEFRVSEVGNEQMEPRNGSRDLELGEDGESVEFEQAEDGHDGELREGKVSDYDSTLSMFDDFAAGSAKHVGYGYEVGDMVWGKVKSHPWWPGHIYNEAFASHSVRRSKREGFVLVAFFGDSSYGWFDPAELIPFEPNFAEKSGQTNSRTFVKAVEEAVDEASRRSGLGLACRCRNAYNFRPTNVDGYFAVDVGDYEPGSVYSANQIKKSRDSFQPRETLTFIKRLAMAPTSSDPWSLYLIKNKATVFAYRKAVFEEFDETYAQAFGYQPSRPSVVPNQAGTPPIKGPSRAPLSGPLVIAEALGKGKSSGKPVKAKDQAKKDKYMFKRRDEANQLKSHQIYKMQTSPSAQAVQMDSSSAIATVDYLLQKRTGTVSSKSESMSKQDVQKPVVGDHASASGQDLNIVESVTIEGKPVMGGSPMNTVKVESSLSSPSSQAASSGFHLLPARSSVDKGSSDLEMKEGRDGLGIVSFTSESGAPEGILKPSQPTSVKWRRRGLGGNVPSGTQGVSGAKKVKVHKRLAGDSSDEKAVLVEKKIKKKRKKEINPETSPDHIEMHAAAGRDGPATREAAEKSSQVASADRDDSPDDLQKVENVTSTSMLPNFIETKLKAGMMDVSIELPQVLNDLQALALNPFHGADRGSPEVVRHVFLCFRSLVYQKSLASSPLAENDVNEALVSKSSSAAAPDSRSSEKDRDLPLSKAPKLSTRHDDPTKGGQKRGPSDRQEDMAAKRKKKITDIRLLAAEKKAAQKMPEAQRDGKEAAVQMPPKVVRPALPTKNVEPRVRAPEPTMLVMKFPPRSTLPSLPELKAKFARFGPMDHSASRIFWKSLTCRVVYMHKTDAQAAYKFASGSNNLFGNTNVRCHLRELESESSKVQREDASAVTPQVRDSAVEPWLAAAPIPQPVQHSAIQLKSCLKKSTGDESVSAPGGNGGGRGTRVKFMLGGEGSGRGEQLMVGTRNNFNNNASFADGGASSSTSHAMDFNSKNFQKVISPSPLPVPQHPTPQFSKAPNNMQYTEVPVVPRNVHNFNTINAPSTSSTTNVDVAPQMLSLLVKCHDIVANLTGLLGYVPYHPL